MEHIICELLLKLFNYFRISILQFLLLPITAFWFKIHISYIFVGSLQLVYGSVGQVYGSARQVYGKTIGLYDYQIVGECLENSVFKW